MTASRSSGAAALVLSVAGLPVGGLCLLLCTSRRSTRISDVMGAFVVALVLELVGVFYAQMVGARTAFWIALIQVVFASALALIALLLAVAMGIAN